MPVPEASFTPTTDSSFVPTSSPIESLMPVSSLSTSLRAAMKLPFMIPAPLPRLQSLHPTHLPSVSTASSTLGSRSNSNFDQDLENDDTEHVIRLSISPGTPDSSESLSSRDSSVSSNGSDEAMMMLSESTFVSPKSNLSSPTFVSQLTLALQEKKRNQLSQQPQSEIQPQPLEESPERSGVDQDNGTVSSVQSPPHLPTLLPAQDKPEHKPESQPHQHRQQTSAFKSIRQYHHMKLRYFHRLNVI